MYRCVTLNSLHSFTTKCTAAKEENREDDIRSLRSPTRPHRLLFYMLRFCIRTTTLVGPRLHPSKDFSVFVGWFGCRIKINLRVYFWVSESQCSEPEIELVPPVSINLNTYGKNTTSTTVLTTCFFLWFNSAVK